MRQSASPGLGGVGPCVPALLALGLTLACLWHVAPMLPGAELWQYDEFYTAERTQGLLDRGDWLTLYSNGLPVFKKPPLQYWTSALLIRAGVEQTLALRMPSLLSALVVAGLTYRLANRLGGGTGWAGIAALVLVTGSGLFWVSATSAMLDMPAAVFVLAAVMATGAAWRRPHLWWAVAALVGLGAMQKAPIALLAVLGTAVVLFLREGPPHRTGRAWAGAALLAVVLVAIWPLVQWAQSGSQPLQVAFLQEQSARFLPGWGGWARHLRWVTWAQADGAVLWAGSLAACLALPRLSRHALALPVAVLVCVGLVALTAARGAVFDRYLVQLLPFAAAAGGAVLALSLRPMLALVLALLVSLSAGGPFKPAAAIGLAGPGMAPFRPMLTEFRAAVRPDESLIVCGWGKSDLILFPGALWLWGSKDKPFRRIWQPDELVQALAIDSIRPPLRGLCLEPEFASLSHVQPGLVAVARDQGFVHWVYRR